jgi:hypothetical protein
MERVHMTWAMDRLLESDNDRKIVVNRGEGKIEVEEVLLEGIEEGAAECSGEVGGAEVIGDDVEELDGEMRERPSDNLQKRSKVAQIVCTVLDQQGVIVVPSSPESCGPPALHMFQTSLRLKHWKNMSVIVHMSPSTRQTLQAAHLVGAGDKTWLEVLPKWEPTSRT